MSSRIAIIQAYERMLNEVMPDGLLFRFKTTRDYRNDRFAACLTLMHRPTPTVRIRVKR
jgi:hypothetical protein